MNPTLSSLQSDVSSAETFFCLEYQVETLPFVHSFPRNSCEVVSAFLAVALQSKYASSTVEVVRAYDRAMNEWHYWVEVDDFVADATAHQFDEYEHSLVLVGPSPLAARFPDIERLQPQAALHSLPNSIQPELKKSIVASLERALAI